LILPHNEKEFGQFHMQMYLV